MDIRLRDGNLNTKIYGKRDDFSFPIVNYPFLDGEGVALYGVEGGGDGIDTPRHAAPLCAGRPGVLHGNRTYLMEDENGTFFFIKK